MHLIDFVLKSGKYKIQAKKLKSFITSDVEDSLDEHPEEEDFEENLE